MNRLWESGSPYFKPLDARKKPVETLFTKTEKWLARRLFIIKATKASLNPNLSNKDHRKNQEMRSKAFIISNFKIRLWPLTCLCNFCTTSWASKILSEMSRPFKKAVRSSEISNGNKLLSRSQRIRVKTLFRKVHKLIGQKYAKNLGHCFFGNNITNLRATDNTWQGDL